MQTYEELAELARMCANNARIANCKEVADALWKMATEYAEKAAKLDSGVLPDIGKPPPWLE